MFINVVNINDLRAIVESIILQWLFMVYECKKDMKDFFY